MTITRHHAARLAAVILATAALFASLCTPAARAASTDRYIITVKSFKAIEESGNDWLGSDEVYGGFQVTDASGEQLAGFRSQLIKGFDAGETKSLDPERNCLPHRQLLERVSSHSFLDARAGDRWLCTRPNTAIGLPGPFTVTGRLWEQESCPLSCSYLREFLLSPWLAEDESLGQAELDFAEHTLAIDLPTLGSSRNYTMLHRDSGAAYRSTINIKRVA